MARVWLCLGIAVGLFLLLELTCRFVLPRVIAIERTRELEVAGAVAKRTGPASQVLMLGNSQLGTGVDLAALRGQLGGQADIRRLMVEDTLFFDWYFGLRRLFAEGAKPDVVALFLGAEQIVSNRSRGEYSAYRLMRTADTLEAGQRLGFSNTATADLFLSSMSAFLGMRNNVRRRVLLATVPGLRSLMPRLNQRDEPMTRPDQALVAARLGEVRDLCAAAGVRFVLVVPPVGDQSFSASVDSVRLASAQIGVAALVPLPPGDVGRADFTDGVHLNEVGAARFTARLATLLADQLNLLRAATPVSAKP
jgi:hypothetical protein